jgi:hypothetical protein
MGCFPTWPAESNQTRPNQSRAEKMTMFDPSHSGDNHDNFVMQFFLSEKRGCVCSQR